MVKKVKIGKHSMRVPGSPRARMILGAALIIGGVLGFLPVLGFWMIPLGLIVLSVDSTTVRRFRRRAETRYGPWLKKNYPRIAGWLGLNGGNAR